MNNEPVAWIANDADLPLKEDGSYWLYPENPSKDNLYIPLYTHPVKELTDEEIERAIQMLKIASEYIRKQYPYGVMFYDDAECDGACIADDCESIAESLKRKL